MGPPCAPPVVDTSRTLRSHEPTHPPSGFPVRAVGQKCRRHLARMSVAPDPVTLIGSLGRGQIMRPGRRIPLPLRPGCLADLRTWARSWMQSHPTGADPDSVLLAMIELVTNSAKHGGGPVDVSLRREVRQLRLSVTDMSDRLPVQPASGDDAEGGRGLALLDVLATSWGVLLRRPIGKTVWCRFSAAASSPPRE